MKSILSVSKEKDAALPAPSVLVQPVSKPQAKKVNRFNLMFEGQNEATMAHLMQEVTQRRRELERQLRTDWWIEDMYPDCVNSLPDEHLAQVWLPEGLVRWQSRPKTRAISSCVFLSLHLYLWGTLVGPANHQCAPPPPAQENYPADAHPSAHKSVLE